MIKLQEKQIKYIIQAYNERIKTTDRLPRDRKLFGWQLQFILRIRYNTEWIEDLKTLDAKGKKVA